VLVAVFSASLYWAGGRGKSGAPRGQWLILLLAVPLLVVALYALRGTPGALNPPPADNTAGMPDPNVMVQRLADHLKQHPEDMDGWLMLARSYTALGRYAEAAAAYESAQTKVMQDSALLVNWIELRVMLAGRKFDPRTQQLVEHAAALTPDDPDVMLLRALAAFDRGDKAAADALVDKLHTRFPPGTPDRESLDAALEKWRSQSNAAPAELGASSQQPAPPAHDADDMNAAVERLAARLKEHPENLDGWVTLARSYATLGRTADADALVRQLHDRFPPGTPERQKLDAALENMKLSATPVKP
jgi:cytochrome c-type biogenesis protein CcmH